MRMNILDWVSGYRPDRDGRQPLGKPTTAPATKQTPGRQLPDNVKANPRTRWLERTTALPDNAVEWEDMHKNPGGAKATGQRSPQVTRDEAQYLTTTRGMNLEKGQELKPYWAAGISITECCQTLGNGYGYKYDTVKKYWRLFNKGIETPSPGGK